MKSYLPAGPKYYPDDQISDHPEQFVVGELIREKILHLTSEEIPHAIGVNVDRMIKEDEDRAFIIMPFCLSNIAAHRLSNLILIF